MMMPLHGDYADGWLATTDPTRPAETGPDDGHYDEAALDRLEWSRAARRFNVDASLVDEDAL